MVGLGLSGLVSSSLLACLAIGVAAQCSGEEEGTIVIQADSVPVTPGWVAETDVKGFFGGSYYTYVGDVRYGMVPTSILNYRVHSPTAADYTVRLWSQRDRLDTDWRSDEGNDLWIQIPGRDDWLKFYTSFGTKDRKWRWGKTFEKGADKFDATVSLAAGENVISIGGRSPRFSWDKLVLTTPTGVDINLAKPVLVDCTTGVAVTPEPVESSSPDITLAPQLYTSERECVDLSQSAIRALLAEAYGESTCQVKELVLFGVKKCHQGICAPLNPTRCARKILAVLKRQFRRRCTVAPSNVSST